MPKRGQHKGDAHDKNVSRGHNNPAKSVKVTTGTYKKEETYAARAREHQDPEPQAQMAKNTWNPDTRKYPSNEAAIEARREKQTRSGSDSNTDRQTRGY